MKVYNGNISRLANLEQLVNDLYEQKSSNRAEWADWLYKNHVYVVADQAVRLAKKYNASEEYARAAALLHDIADAVMSRFDDNHEATSLQLARELLEKSGFKDEEISLIVDDAIRFHSCHDGRVPSSLEGKILATADSYAHLKTDFYVYATWAMGQTTPLDEVKSWVLKKLDRDLHDKVLFDDEKADLLSDYEMLKELYSR